MAALSECLETLTPRSQQIIRLRYFENRSGSKIANYLGSKVQS
ncbi:sigma factor-like helix-turn-helix DNA-binding protein [Novipirellula sp. SH528]